MAVTSMTFALFVAALLILYYLVPRHLQWLLLLVGSYVFYLWAGPKYLFFILFTTVTTYGASLYMDAQQKKRDAYLAEHKASLSREEKKAYKTAVKARSRVGLILCLVANFAILALCKALLIDPFRAAAATGALSFLSLGLPLGISFYMFQSMGYLVDVYRETVKAERNFLKLALFVSYFPQLIQGPISKFSQIGTQLTAGHSFDGCQVAFGLERMLWGFFKKMVVADRIAVAIGTLRGEGYGGVYFFLLTLAYAIQIYGDFTGGIDVTIGLSQALGIRLPENFRRPFFSKNIAEYWRRWHITLGEWMKDYIFYPISVSGPMRSLSKTARKKFPNFGKRLPVYVASVITWLATGIWHGFSPNFALWGLLNCLVIVISEELQPLYARFHARFHLKDKGWYGVFEMLRMFLLMNLIRACDLFADVGEYFRRMGSLFTTWNFRVLWDGSLMKLGLTGLDFGILAFGIVLMLGVSLYQEKRGSVREGLAHQNAIVRCAAIFTLLVLVLLMGSYGIGYDSGNFIYNQF